MFFVLAMALAAFAVPAVAQSAMVGSGGTDILGGGIFETGGDAFKFPSTADTNFDSVEVGNDKALAISGFGQGAIESGTNQAAVTARNNLKIKKSQDSGECACCQALDASSPFKDCCTKYNVEQMKVGSRSATAVGLSGQLSFPLAENNASTLAQNNVEIETNQQ